jgi:hypothetical protein
MTINEQLRPRPSVIYLPELPVRTQQLHQKMREYKDRFKKERSAEPYRPPEDFPTFYAIKILGALLLDGEVDFERISRQLAREQGGRISRADYFENYFGVIMDYAETGGVHNTQKLYPLKIR